MTLGAPQFETEWQTVTIGGNAVDLPVIRSAGVDLVYGTNDDIVSIDGNGILLKMKQQQGIQSGFTLIELLVVVTILELLAVVVLQNFTAGGDKRLLQQAADRLDTHLKQAAAQLWGKPRGYAVWLDAEHWNGYHFDLNFARMPTGELFDDRTITPGTPGPNFAELSPDINKTIGSVVKFDMVPTEFELPP